MFALKKIKIFFEDLLNRFLYFPGVLSFLKIKALKLAMKFIILAGVLWFFSGSWLGSKLRPLINTISGGTCHLFAGIIDLIQIVTQGLLILILVLTVLGKPIWRGYYILIGLGLLITLLQRFVF
jgi:hypothetical protein